jgi:hypothetical protein
MIDTVLNLLFRCSHRRLSRPVTPVSTTGVPQGETYVVCLDCGKHFAYDTKEMRIGRPINDPRPSGVLQPDRAKAGDRRLKWAALWASIPLAMLIGSHLRAKKPKSQHDKPAAHVPPAQ